MTAAALAAILTARIAQKPCYRVGVRVGLGKGIGGRLAAFFWPRRLDRHGAATIYDIVRRQSKAVQKCKDAVWKSYNDTSEQLLSDTFCAT